MAWNEEPLSFAELAEAETIDEQIDQRLRERSFSSSRQRAEPDARLIQELHDYYGPQAETIADGLDRVWERLERRSAASFRRHQRRLAPGNASARLSARQRPMQRTRRAGPRWSSRLAALVAVALLVVLVGGLTLGLVLVHRPGNAAGGNPPGHVTPTARQLSPTPTPAPGAGVHLLTIHMIDATTGWAGGPLVKAWRVLRTTDGGVHWKDVTPPSAPAQQGEIPAFFLNAAVAWVAPLQSDGKTLVFFRTTDGGQTWQREGSVRDGPESQMIFIDAQHGWLLTLPVGGGVGDIPVDLFRTTNGGASWVKIQSIRGAAPPGELPGGQSITLSFLNASTGWATGTGDVTQNNFFWLYVTHDGGFTWKHQTLPLPAGVTQGFFSITPPTFFNARDGVLPVSIGTANTSYLDVYVTHDGGDSWQSTSLLPTKSGSADFSDADHGWAIDTAALFATSDGGQHWKKLSTNLDFNNLVVSLHFISTTIGWVLSDTPSGDALLLKTEDGGQTWTNVPMGIQTP